MTILAPSPTPPSASPPPSLSPAGRTGLRAILVIAAVLLMLLGLGALAAVAVGVGSTRVVADSQPLSATMRTLTVDTGAVPMSVEIETDADAREPRADLRFVGTADSGDHSLDIATAGSDTRISLQGSTPDWLEWAQAGRLTIVLPPQLSQRLTVTTEQQLGVLKVQADLDRLIARSTGGAVILEGSARVIEADVRQGAVISDDPVRVRESFSANVTEGDIDVTFRDEPPRSIKAETSNGDVALDLPGDGPFLVTAIADNEYDGAEVRVPQTTNPDEATSRINAHTGSGGIVIDQVR
jgi:hypothetical protein